MAGTRDTRLGTVMMTRAALASLFLCKSICSYRPAFHVVSKPAAPPGAPSETLPLLRDAVRFLEPIGENGARFPGGRMLHREQGSEGGFAISS